MAKAIIIFSTQDDQAIIKCFLKKGNSKIRLDIERKIC